MLKFRPLRVTIITTLGRGGRGGIDRLNDSVVDAIKQRPELYVDVTSLAARGPYSIRVAPLFFAWALLRFVTAAARRKIDVLHIHMATKGSVYRKLIFAHLSRAFGIPYIIHLHGGTFDEYWPSVGRFLRRMINQTLNRSAKIIVLGNYWKQVIVEGLPQSDGKIIVLPNASASSPQSQIRPTNSQVRITFLGRVVRDKGVPELIEALGHIAHRSDWIATVAGDGELEQSRSHVKQLRISDRVSFPGWLDSDATAELLRRTDILVLPSFAECLPMSVIEAFAHGIAVVATPVGALPETIISEYDGILVPVGDVDALGKAMERLIDHPELRASLGSAARAKHEKCYKVDGYVLRLVDVWRRAAVEYYNL